MRSILLPLSLGLAAQGGAASAQDIQTTVVAGGCFWCVEADFEGVEGVREVVSGYAGGDVENPTYREVVRGGTGHREVAEITYDADVLSYEDLIGLFLRSIDPLDGGGQFCDRGFSYSPAIYVEGAEERAIAEAEIAEAEAELGQDLSVPIESLDTFYAAEAYHQDYYRSDEIILTRFGPRRKEVAYDLYRDACGRDARVRQVWGDDAPFVHAEG